MGRFTRGVWAGVLLVSALGGIRQDLMGKERYIAYVESAWIDTKYTAWLNALTLLGGVALVLSEKRKSPEDDS